LTRKTIKIDEATANLAAAEGILEVTKADIGSILAVYSVSKLMSNQLGKH
jgi:membrane fusion protein (multidrug efflux system)